jgi:hypothetical protein
MMAHVYVLLRIIAKVYINYFVERKPWPTFIRSNLAYQLRDLE